MLHEKVGKRGTRNRGRYQVAQSRLNRLYSCSPFKGPLIYKVTGGGGIYGDHFKFIYLLGWSKVKNWKSLSALAKIPHKTIEQHL